MKASALLIALLLSLTHVSVSQQNSTSRKTALNHAEIGQLRTDANLTESDRILTLDAQTLGRGQILLVTARHVGSNAQWCLDVAVYKHERHGFKLLWNAGEGLSDSGCHETTCGEPSARALRIGEILFVFPTLNGNYCELHELTYRWSGKTFVLKERHVGQPQS